MKRLLPCLLLAALMLLSGCSALDFLLDSTPDTVTESGGVSDSGELYQVLRVVDGDTIEIDYHGDKEKVRLIGVDTPESVHPDAEKNTDYGKIAAEFTKEQLEGQLVALEFDVEPRDKYGRLLAYVYLDGEMFNSTLLLQGHAMVATFPPNVKYVDLFVSQQQAAREAAVGLWANVLSSGEYVASLGSDKYHLASCSSAQRIKEENRIWFNDPSAAESIGYEPCSICHPDGQ